MMAQCTVSNVYVAKVQHRSFDHRWPLLLTTVKGFMQTGDIIVLQEVDVLMIRQGLIETLFMGGYNVFQGILSLPLMQTCLIAFPHDRFIPIQFGEEFVGHMVNYNNTLHCRLPPSDPALIAAVQRNRSMPWVHLVERSTQKGFFIFTCKMPCLFERPEVMAVQLDSMIPRMWDMAGDTPFLFAGDFNFTPNSALYRFATTNIAEASIRPNPMWTGACWHPLIDPVAFGNHAPFVTNRATNSETREVFQGRIDYVWTSSNIWELTKLQVEDVANDLPDQLHGSDHVPVTYTFALH